MNRFHVAIFVVVGFLAFGGPARGQTQIELNQQAEQAFQKADENLNAAYKKLLATLDNDGKKKLREAERAWIKYRDAECESVADDYRGGSIMPLIYYICAERLTKSRTEELEDRLKP